jgi:hypothetical protein
LAGSTVTFGEFKITFEEFNITFGGLKLMITFGGLTKNYHGYYTINF